MFVREAKPMRFSHLDDRGEWKSQKKTLLKTMTTKKSILDETVAECENRNYVEVRDEVFENRSMLLIRKFHHVRLEKITHGTMRRNLVTIFGSIYLSLLHSQNLPISILRQTNVTLITSVPLRGLFWNTFPQSYLHVFSFCENSLEQIPQKPQIRSSVLKRLRSQKMIAVGKDSWETIERNNFVLKCFEQEFLQATRVFPKINKSDKFSLEHFFSYFPLLGKSFVILLACQNKRNFYCL